MCFAVGVAGTILSTTNGGANWNPQASGTTNQLNGISCPSSSACYAVGSLTSSLGTIDGGAHWNPQGAIAESLLAVTCPSVTTCYAVGTKIHVTTDNGVTWTDTTADVSNYNAISCATTTVCTAVRNNGAESTADGSTWGLHAVNGDLVGVSCPSTTTCVAGGAGPLGAGAIYRTTDAGATPWQFVAPSGTTSSIGAVSCPTTTTCFAGSGQSVLRTTNGGLGWYSILTTGSTSIAAISCPSATVCFAAGPASCCSGATIMATTDGGDHWTDEVTAPPGPPGSPGFVSISCVTHSPLMAPSSRRSMAPTGAPRRP